VSARTVAGAIVRKIDPARRQALAADPLGALKEHFGLSVQEASSPRRRGAGGECDGMSFLDQKLVLYRRTYESHRENFTLLHELGHFLVEEDEDAIDWIGRQPRAERARLKEEVCNHVAALLLLPSEKIDTVVGADKPSGEHLRELFRESVASRQVCAIALAERLGCEGFTALVSFWDPSTVAFASRRAETHPVPRKGADIPATHPLRRVRRGETLRCRAWWPAADGLQRTYYMSAAADEDFVYAVFAAIDLWSVEKLHIEDPLPPVRQRDGVRVDCPSCQQSALSFEPVCGSCGRVPCAKCDRCGCNQVAPGDKPCKGCNLIHAKRLLMPWGYCPECVRKGLAPGGGNRPR
jgi:hypothetical protein